MYQTKMHILIEEINLYLQNEELYKKSSILREFKKVFPNLEDNELIKIIEVFELYNQKNRNNALSAEFVTTLPSQIRHVGSRKTLAVLRESIYSSEQNILITGYSVSDFAKELIELLRKKSSDGVVVKFFIDKYVDEAIFNTQDGRELNFEIYKLLHSSLYSNLHAKIAVFDSKYALISSSNLSYNGMINNIEIGNLLYGDKVREIETIFEEMFQKGFFERIN